MGARMPGAAGAVIAGASIALPAQAGSCTRADLQTCRPQATAVDKDILRTRMKIDFHRSLLGTTTCETFAEVIVTDPMPTITWSSRQVKTGA